ncbi:dethiobiotin synthase, partial [Corallococcus exiguus]|uniref:ATP-dependent dethiobiotin synthetase BioD n=3 Tax=Myxococcaceae TaxID=31 RepID=UPI00147333A4
AVVVEGAGGLFVPVDSKRDVVDLIQAFRLPVVLVARAGLGTLNHVALSLEALAARKVSVRAVVLSRGVPGRDLSERDNRRYLEARHGVEVLGPVPYVEDPKKRQFAFRRALAPLVSERARAR